MTDLIPAFLAYLAEEKHASANTLAAYRNDISQLASALDGDVTRLTRPRLIAYLEDRERCYGSTATVARKAASIASFCRWLVAQGVMTDNPADGLARPVVPGPVRTITTAQVGALLAAAKSPRDEAILRVTACAGLTASEAVALNVSDMDLTTRYVRVADESSERYVPIDAATTDALRFLVGSRRDGAVFANHRGERLTRQGLWLILKGLCAAAGLPSNVSARTLRHSFALQLLREQTSLQDVQALLGHVHKVTTKRYQDAYRDELRRPRIAA